MKTFTFSLLLLILWIGLSNAQIVEIPDTSFLYALIDEGVDTDGDSLISYEEAEAATSLSVTGGYGLNDCWERGCITSSKGIEAFINLDTLIIDYNYITDLNVSNITSLKYLSCKCNQLTSLDVSPFASLTTLQCDSNMLTSLDVSTNTALTDLRCGINLLTTLDVSNNTALTDLRCGYNLLTSLDVSKNTALTTLWCWVNQINSLDVSNNIALTTLRCSENELTNLDVSKNTALTTLWCFDNELTSLDVSKNTALTTLWCFDNELTSLDISKNTSLKELWCHTNKLTSLDLSNNIALVDVRCGFDIEYPGITSANPMSSLDISNCPLLEILNCNGCELTTLDLCNNDSIGNLDLRDMPTLDTVYVKTASDQTSGVDVTGSPNVVFKNCSNVGMMGINQKRLSIYPNPANDLLSIESNRPGLHSVELYSISGQLISTNKMEESTLQIDLSSFQKGIYLITVRSRDFVRTEKIIKL